jgi:hypothetical protein
MSKIFTKGKPLFLLVLLIPILAYLISYIYGIKTVEIEEKTEIFEINNTKEVYNYPDSSVITIMKHFIVVNPPEDVNELEKLVEEFIEENPIVEENVITTNKDRKYDVFFTRRAKSYHEIGSQMRATYIQIELNIIKRI